MAGGALWLALPIAFAAGVVAFLSPCVLPLAPGYVSYITGLTGAELADRGGRPGRVLAGSLLFVLGFSVVFVSYGVLFGGVGAVLLEYADPITRVLRGGHRYGPGVLRAHPRPAARVAHASAPHAGLAGAPLLGLLFAIGWTPCIGPTLTAVQSLAFSCRRAHCAEPCCPSSTALAWALPFVLLAVAFSRFAGALAWVRRHYVWVMRIGGGMLIVVGVLLVTGLWNEAMIWLRVQTPGFEAPRRRRHPARRRRRVRLRARACRHWAGSACCGGRGGS